MMTPTEEDLKELSDKEFKRILVTMSKQFINVPPENKNKELKKQGSQLRIGKYSSIKRYICRRNPKLK